MNYINNYHKKNFYIYNKNISIPPNINQDIYTAYYISLSELFDTTWYLKKYPDVAVSEIDPILHYIRYGVKEGRNPTPWFDTNKYLLVNPEIKDININPFFHYIKNFLYKKNIPIVFSTNDNYSIHLCVAIKSIIENSNIEYIYNIYILYTQLNEDNINKIKLLGTKNIHIHTINIFNLIDTSKLYINDHFSIEMYYRVLIPELFFFYEKVIYIDCDIVCLKDISILYNTHIKNYMIAAVINFSGEWYKKYFYKVFKINIKKIFNSGVILFNIKKCIEEKSKEKFFDLLNKTKDIFCPDQTLLNVVCFDKILFLNSKWNYQWGATIEKKINELSETERKEYINAIEDPYIIHYTTGYKPWDHPENKLSQLYWKYRNIETEGK